MLQTLDLGSINTCQLDFVAPFTLTCDSQRLIKCHAIVLYFDTFFSTSPEAISVTENQVSFVKDGEPVLAEVWHVGGRPSRKSSRREAPISELPSEKDTVSSIPKITSFSTSPQSIPTHWKQTIFLLREPIMAQAG